MRAVLIASAVLALALASCGGGGGGGGASDAMVDARVIPLELDVFLNPRNATVVLATNQPDPRMACEPPPRWSLHPECTTFTDYGTCGPGAPLPSDVCVIRASLVAAGAELVAVSGPLVGGFQLSPARPADTLVLSGCDKEARIALPLVRIDEPRLVSLGGDTSALVIDWVSAEPLVDARASIGNGYSGITCGVAASSPVRFPLPPESLTGQTVSLGGRIARGEMATEFGPTRLWISTWSESGPMTVPVREQDHWKLRSYTGTSVDMGFPPRVSGPTVLEFEADATSTRVVALTAPFDLLVPPPAMGGVRYRVTPAGASLEVELETGIYRATLEPVVPSDPLVLGGPGNESFAMSIGPLEIVNASGDRKQVAVTFSAMLGVVVRPL